MGEQSTWTFVVDFDGGTYVSQYECLSLQEAIARYNQNDPSGQGAIPVGSDVMPLDGQPGVFCTSGVSKSGSLILVNIVKTVR